MGSSIHGIMVLLGKNRWVTDWRRGVKEREVTRSDYESRRREGSWQDGRAVDKHREAGTGCWDGREVPSLVLAVGF